MATEATRAVEREKKKGLAAFFDLNNPAKFGLVLILPAQILLLFIVAFPTALELYISTTQWSPSRGGNWWDAYRFWSWGSNYLDLIIHDPSFIWSVLRTFLIVGVAVPLEFGIGLALAFLFLNDFPGKRVFTSIMLTPMMIVPAVAGYIFFMIFQSNGPLNGLIGFVIQRHVDYPWLTKDGTALLAVILQDVWQWTPLMFLILLSGIVGLPEDQMKAATILGASLWQRFWTLMLPMLKPIIIIALIIRGMEAVKVFDAVWLMTSGGPGEATQTISVFMYKMGFINIRWAYIAAGAIMILILMSIIATYAIKPLQAAEAGPAPAEETAPGQAAVRAALEEA